MPQSYSPTQNSNAVYSIPQYTEAADGVQAFKDYSGQIDYALVPIGAVMPFAGPAAPAGWLLCDGKSYKTTDFPVLSKLIGQTYGGTGEEFAVPNLMGRVVVGVDPADTDFAKPGAKGGTKSTTLSIDNVPGHNHTGSTIVGKWTVTSGNQSALHIHAGTADAVADHTHTNSARTITDVNRGDAFKSNALVSTGPTNSEKTGAAGGHSHSIKTTTEFKQNEFATGYHTHNVDVDMSNAALNIAEQGKGTPIITMGPFMALNYIIRAG